VKRLMKLTLYAILGFALASIGQAQQRDLPPVPEWNATVKVVDESGQPVPGADVTIGYYVPPSEGESVGLASKKGFTDTNGVFSASERSTTTDLFIGAGKQGYYRAHLDYELGLWLQYDPVKWSPSVTLLLKRIRDPIPMYAQSVNLGMPVFGDAAGFDLVTGDWITPHGKGTRTDIIFTAYRDKRSDYDSDYRLVVSFPNQGDGIQEFVLSALEKTSSLRSPHEAPADGYQPEWVQTSIRRPGQAIQTNRDENRNYFFRVRTVLDENGEVKSAHYGKIYGDFLHFRYYLNSTPNDRNVEFDPKRNLFPVNARGGVSMDMP
jgi:hypothetical protein